MEGEAKPIVTEVLPVPKTAVMMTNHLLKVPAPLVEGLEQLLEIYGRGVEVHFLLVSLMKCYSVEAGVGVALGLDLKEQAEMEPEAHFEAAQAVLLSSLVVTHFWKGEKVRVETG